MLIIETVPELVDDILELLVDESVESTTDDELSELYDILNHDTKVKKINLIVHDESLEESLLDVNSIIG